MEVSGQQAFRSKYKSNMYCLPCHRDGLKEPAYGYCQNCQEHLCKICFQHHKRSKPSRNHILLDKDALPMEQTTDDFKPDDITDVCTKHSDKLLEFYCNTHKSVTCYVCVTLEHKQCNIDYIPDISGNVSSELRNLFTNMEELIKKCESNIRRAQSATRNLDQNQEVVIKGIQLFRKEINAHLDQMESRMKEQTEYLVDTAKRKLENVKDACLEIANELKYSQSFLTSLSDENKIDQQFIEIKKVGPRVTTLTDRERQVVEDNETDYCIEFVRNEKIFDQLKLEKSFGMISTYKKPSEDKVLSFQYERTISVKSSSDKGNCKGFGMVLFSTSITIVADNYNDKIKMINVHNGSLVSEITLSSEPQDIINLPQNKLAVTLPCEECIQIVSFTDTSLSLDRRIKVGDTCYCVAYCQGKLVVGCNFNPGKLVILDLDGSIKQLFNTPGMFTGPEKIIISSDEKFLYISDDDYCGIGRFIKMDWQGNVVERFEQPGCERPMGIQVLEDSTLLVCYWQSNNIVRLSSSFKICEAVGLEKAHLLNRPKALAYSEKDHKLYIGCYLADGEKGIIKVFNVKWV